MQTWKHTYIVIRACITIHAYTRAVRPYIHAYNDDDHALQYMHIVSFIHMFFNVAMPGLPMPRTKTFQITSNENSELLGRSWVNCKGVSYSRFLSTYHLQRIFLKNTICKKLHIYFIHVVAIWCWPSDKLIFVYHVDGICVSANFLQVPSTCSRLLGDWDQVADQQRLQWHSGWSGASLRCLSPARVKPERP